TGRPPPAPQRAGRRPRRNGSPAARAATGRPPLAPQRFELWSSWQQQLEALVEAGPPARTAVGSVALEDRLEVGAAGEDPVEVTAVPTQPGGDERVGHRGGGEPHQERGLQR